MSSSSRAASLLALVCLAIAILGFAAVVVIVWRRPHQSNTNNPNGRQETWRDEVCRSNGTCARWSQRPLLLISMDGFRALYLQRHKTPAISHLIDCGTHSPFMYACYPTKTFPNHYSIVTGLYPESHGIVDNHAFDPTITPAKDRLFVLGKPSSFNPQWWKGEPFWNTVMKNGMKAATFFWVGSEVKIQGMLPSYYRRYSYKVSFSERVDQVIEWLLLPDDARPTFLTLYFEQPDGYGHKFGPASNGAADALLLVDSMINYLMISLHKHNLIQCIDIILLADHGMQALIPDAIMAVDGYLNTTGMYVFSAPVGRIHVENSSLTVDEVVADLECKNDSFRVYRREETPRRLHYSKSARCGDVIIDSDPGFRVANHFPSDQSLGGHGFDYRIASMHALFAATGPSFKKNFTGQPFENIQLYHLMSDLLHIGLEKRAPNNGTLGSLRYMLAGSPPPPRREVKQPPSCNFGPIIGCGRCRIVGCLHEGNPACGTLLKPLALDASTQRQTCTYNGCHFTSVYSQQLKAALFVQGAVTRQSAVNLGAPGCNYASSADCADIQQFVGKLSTRQMRFAPLYAFGYESESNRYSQKAPMHNGFVTDVWSKLQDLTVSYTQQFGRLLSISGVIFDFNNDGLADSLEEIATNTIDGLPPIPTHFYQILLRCDAGWLPDSRCAEPKSHRVLSFVLPNKAVIDNCQTFRQHAFMNTATVRDIEHLTGLHFFTTFPPQLSIELRIKINQNLW